MVLLMKSAHAFRRRGPADRRSGSALRVRRCSAGGCPGLAKNVILFKPGAALLFSLPFASACAIDLHHKFNEDRRNSHYDATPLSADIVCKEDSGVPIKHREIEESFGCKRDPGGKNSHGSRTRRYARSLRFLFWSTFVKESCKTKGRCSVSHRYP
jgi:hypothetical protein